MMSIDDQIKDEKLQHNTNREALEISALSLGKIHNYEYLTREETLPFDPKQITEQAEITYSPMAKAFEKRIKTIEH